MPCPKFQGNRTILVKTLHRIQIAETSKEQDKDD